MDRLAQDAIAAEKAGMSYGQWKAFHPHTGDDDRPVLIEGVNGVIRCGICGKLFKYRGQRGNKLYCSPECSYEAKTKRDMECKQRKHERKKENAKN